MVGVRIRIVDNADQVRVVSLTPQRTYDLQSERFADLVGVDLRAGPEGRHPDRPRRRRQGPRGGGQAQPRSAPRSASNFLSRLSKQGAVVDGPNHEFGWNFYPTNLQVNNVPAFSRVLSSLFGTPRSYTVNAYLDGGSYNCGAYVVVDPEVDSFSYSVDYVYARLDASGNGGPERRYYKDADGGFRKAKPRDQEPRPTHTVTLPTPASPYELDAAFSPSTR